MSNSPSKNNPKSAQAGKRFQTLFGASSGDSVLSGLKLVSLTRISTGAQPRTKFPQEEIDELAKSISELRELGEGIEGTGILQPLLVNRIEDDLGDSPYRLVAGERRFRASRQAGLQEVPVIEIKGGVGGEFDSQQSNLLAMQLVENLQRRDLPPLDEARAFKQMMELRGLSQRDTAQLLGKSRGYLQNRLDLLQMGDDVHAMLDARPSTMRVAAHINRVSDPVLRSELIRNVLDENWSERDVLSSIQKQDVSEEKKSDTGENVELDNSTTSTPETNIHAPKNARIKSMLKVSAVAKQSVTALQSIEERCNETLSATEKKKLLKSLKQIEGIISLLKRKVE